jgi:hypothetical protein
VPRSSSREYQRNYYQKNKHKWDHKSIRAKRVVRDYGITIQQRDNIIANQQGLCAICLNVLPPGQGMHIDHDHLTGRVRGILCRTCNMGLGLFKDSRALLEQAARYLSKHNALNN